MSNSVVMVTEPRPNDSLILVVGQDGTVTPDKETVETFLNSRIGPTELQVMHVNKMDGVNIDVTVDTLMYVHNNESSISTEEIIEEVEQVVENPRHDMDEIARNLLNFRMDHDYTPLTSPKHTSSAIQEIPSLAEIDDELANTLRILEGDGPEEHHPELLEVRKQQKPPPEPPKPPNRRASTHKVKAKMISTNPAQTKSTPKPKPVPKTPAKPTKPHLEEHVDDEEEDDDDEDFMDTTYDELEDDLNDSDFELEEPVKSRPKRATRRRGKSINLEVNETPSKVKPVKRPKTPKAVKAPPKPEPEPPKVEKAPTPPPEPKPVEKKPPKKEKKAPKLIPDDFALFSTPDIMKRVGGKEPTTPVTPTTPDPAKTPKPAKITPESRSKSGSSAEKSKRLSTSMKSPTSTTVLERRHSSEKHQKKDPERRLSVSSDVKKLQQTLESSLPSSSFAGEVSTSTGDGAIDPLPNIEDISNIIQGVDHDNMNLEAGGLDIDQSLLDNIGTEMIPEDILYQVAKSLVDNQELQNVIDKSISDGNLVLDPSVQQALNENILPPATTANMDMIQQPDLDKLADITQGKQVFRGGRIINIPPIERPTTRSRNKKVPDVEKPQLKVLKPLDDDHIFGSDLESSDDDEDKEEDEDDPNKLWCICNTPHNNRFMICCDICEEWYHGKCVNVTKAMGQMMEQEGKEWICLYCKDKSLTRPTAAARRLRKASRTSTDSQGSSKQSSVSTPTEPISSSDTQCIVCGQPSRNSSIYCSDVCIQKHAQGFKRSIVINRKTGKCLSGADAPSEAELKQWLEKNPGWEVLRSTNKQGVKTTLTQSKLKVVKNTNNDGVSLAVQKKGVSIGVMQHAPKNPEKPNTTPTPNKKPLSLKMPGKAPTTPQMKQIKLIQAQPVKQVPTSPSVSSTPVKVKQAPPTPKLTPPTPKPKESPKDKPTPVKTPKLRQAETPHKKEQKEENIRENVKKTLFEQLTNRVKLAENFSLTEEEIQSISLDIETQLYKCFGDTGQKYRNKYRSLMFNIKDIKNETLWRRICEKSINPYQLVRLSPDDLASQELALWREREAKHTLDMIKKSELESLNYNRQMVFKTHKGEQILEDDRPVDNADVIASLGTENAGVDNPDSSKRDHSKEREKRSKHKHHRSRSKDRDKSRDRAKSHDRNKDRKSSSDKSSSKDHKREHRSSSKDRRKRSRSRDRSRHSDRKRSRSRDRDRHRRSSHKSSRHKKESHSTTTEKLDNRSKEILEKLVDNRVLPPLEDRLWKHVPQDDIVPTPIVESDSDHEPSSTVTIPTPPRSVDPDEVTTQVSTDIDKAEKQETEKRHVKETEDGSSSPPPQKISRKEEPALAVWKGSINMVDVAETSIVAEEVSGDCNGLSDELPSVLEVVGRIAPEIVWEYIGKMKSSNSKTISLIRLIAKNVEEKMPYLALYTYLSSRNRLGVVKSNHKAIKDFYIFPLGFRQPIPQALLPINGPGFEEHRPPLLLGIIVRDKRKRPILDGLPSISKRAKVEITPTVNATTTSVTQNSSRSYTPPPSRDPRLKLPGPSPSLPIPIISTPPPPLPRPVPAPLPPEPENDGDAPYSPGDSDPDTSLPPPAPVPAPSSASFIETQAFEPFSNKFDTIPGLDTSSSQEIQRKIGEIDEGINQCQAEIDSLISNKYIANAEIGQSALANISIPSNLQQILENIKSISKTDSNSQEYTPAPVQSNPKPSTTSDLTIPLMLPKISSRTSISRQDSASSSPTIPLNLPKIKSKSVNSPLISYSTEQPDKSGSVLSSLSEEDLIRKAAEMLGETSSAKPKDSGPSYRPSFVPPPPPPTQLFNTPPPPIMPPLNVTLSPPSKRSRVDLNLPPVPGLEDEG